MTESEAKLRIEQSFKHGSEIKEKLKELHVLVGKQKPSQVSHKLKPDFIGPYDFSISETRWNNCCISATKQLYGSNQNISTIKQQLNTNKQDIFTLRLIAQTSLKCNMMLKSLLQFPEQLQAKSDEPVVMRVAAACSDLLTLLTSAGILEPDTTNSGQHEAGVAGSNDTSLVESEVIQTLHNEGRVAKHLSDLAAERLGNKVADPSAMTAGVGLAGGCTLHLLHDSLSNRLAAKAAVAKPVPLHKYTIRRSNAMRSSVKTGSLKAKKTLNCTRNGAKPTTASTTTSKHSHLAATAAVKRRTSGGKSNKKADTKRARSKTHRIEKAQHRNGVSVDDEQRERERLWRQLMPLLANQDVVLHNDDEQNQDWWATVEHLDQLLARATTLETEVQATHQLLADSDNRLHSSSGTDSELDSAIQEAHNMLRNTGFLPPRSAEDSLIRGDYETSTQRHNLERETQPSAHTQDSLDKRRLIPRDYVEVDRSRRWCSCNDGDDGHGRHCSNCGAEALAHGGDEMSSPGGLDEQRRVREDFWTGLAASGHVET